MANPIEVNPSDDDIDRMISVPLPLKANDGRVFVIGKWCPVIDIEHGTVRIEATLILRRFENPKS